MKTKYFVYSLLAWIIIDWGTAGGLRLAYFTTPPSYIVILPLLYAIFSLIFTWLIFKLGFSDKKLFSAMLVLIFVVEVVMVRNPLLIQFPLLLLGIPLAIAVYIPLIYFPLWIARKEMRTHKKTIFLLSIVVIAITILSVISKSRETRVSKDPVKEDMTCQYEKRPLLKEKLRQPRAGMHIKWKRLGNIRQGNTAKYSYG